MRESGPVGAPAIVFLHGGNMSGWSWEPVVERMQQYRCLVPDLPHYGKSFQQGPFEMGRAAAAVAELIRSRVGAGRAHVVGFSLGAQVGVQLLATEPKLVDRAVLSGTVINTMPFVRQTQLLLGDDLPQRGISPAGQPLPKFPPGADSRRPSIDEYREDVRLITSGQLADVVVASAGFTLPEGLDKSDSPTLFRHRHQGDAGHTPLGCSARAANAQRSRQGRRPECSTTGPCAIQTCSRAPSMAGSPIVRCLPRSHCRTRVVADSRARALSEMPTRRAYLRHNTPLPSMSTMSADIPCFAR